MKRGEAQDGLWWSAVAVLTFAVVLVQLDVHQMDRRLHEATERAARQAAEPSYDGVVVPVAAAKSRSLSRKELACSPGFFTFANDLVCAFGEPVALLALNTALPDNVAQFGPDMLAWIVVNGADNALPSEVGTLSGLEYLLMRNAMQGTIPTQVGTLSALKFFSIDYNMFVVGSVPSELFQLPLLEVVTLSSNRLSGEFPTELFGLSNLNYLDVSDSGLRMYLDSRIGLLRNLALWRVDVGSITGSLPTQLGNLTALFELTVSDSSLEGTVPTQLGLLSGLTQLSLDGNKLRGGVPSQLALCTGLSSLALGDNTFGGMVPTQLGLLSGLGSLALGGNVLSGSIPTQLGLLTGLGSLALNGNALSGSIPTQLGLLTALESLMLVSNELTGTIPTQLGLMVALTELYLGHNQLEGTVPTQLLLLPDLALLGVGDNKLSGVVPDFGPGTHVQCDDSGLRSGTNSTCRLLKEDWLDDKVFYATMALAGATFLGLVFLMSVFFRKRKDPMVRSTNPTFSALTMFGLLVLLLMIPCLGLALRDIGADARTHLCRASVHLFCYGVTIVLASISARNYPIWRIFDNPLMEARRIAPSKLLSVVMLTVVANAFVVSAALWDARSGIDLSCVADASFPLVVAEIALLFALAGVTTYIAFKIRKVPSKYNDTQRITRASFSMVSFGAVIVVLASTTTDTDSFFLSVTVAVVLLILTFVAMVHVPKLLPPVDPSQPKPMVLLGTFGSSGTNSKTPSNPN